MSEGYAFAPATSLGAQPRMVCTVHPGCSWFFPLVGQRPANDAILRAQFAHHVSEHQSSSKVLGHTRRLRF